MKQNEKESENRQREQPLWRQGASGRHVWDTVRHYNNMTQAELNEALQALTAQIPDRGQRMEASGKEKKWSRWKDRKKSDTSHTMTRGEHQSGSNKTASRRAATSRHTPRTLGNLQEILNPGMRHRHIGSNIGGTNRIEKVNVVDDFPHRALGTLRADRLT